MKQRLSRPKLTAQETRLIQQLRQQPEMSARVQGILELAHAAEGPLKTADEIEALLIQELRQLGRTPMNQWAVQAEERVRGLKKNADLVVRLWRGDGERAALAQPEQQLPPPPCPHAWA